MIGGKLYTEEVFSHTYSSHPPLPNVLLMDRSLHSKMFPQCIRQELSVGFWELDHKCIEVPLCTLTVLGIVDLRAQRIDFLFWEITYKKTLGVFFCINIWFTDLINCSVVRDKQLEK